VKNKRVTHRPAKEKRKPKSSIFMIYDTERNKRKNKKKSEIEGIMHAQRDSTIKLSARQTTDVKR
jgi:hypothetical protein